MNTCRWLVVAVFLLTLTLTANAAIYYVSPSGSDNFDGSSWAQAKKTVQAGINAAFDNNGGEVWVAAGTYYERITLKANCYLYGGFAGTETDRNQRDFSVNKSILDGSRIGDVVAAYEIGTAACIDGFTIRNAGGDFSGINCSSASNPVITNNTIIKNGFGISCFLSSNPVITKNTISDNGNSGIVCSNSSPTVTNNTVSGSSSGIYCASASSPEIANNIICENSNYGICCMSSNPTITNNTINGNGYYGIYCHLSSPTVANNIIAFNTTGIYSYNGSSILKSNCIYGNITNYSGLTAGATDISEDPMLENWRYGKVHIQLGSPCIGAGDRLVVDDTWVDMDGQSRIQGYNVDIGADESDGTLWTINPPIVVFVNPDGDDANDGSSWSLAKQTVQAGIDAAYNNGGGEVWVAAGVYDGLITLKADCDIYGGFAGTESKREQRSFSINKSILCGYDDEVIRARGTSTIARIDGFTIRNNNGGYFGIYCTSSSPTVANNIISGFNTGIYCMSSSASIINNKISGNSMLGISCLLSNLTITNNTISGSDNGIHSYASNSIIANNIVAFNNIGIYRYNGVSGTPILESNCVYGNTTNYKNISAGATDISKDPLFRDFQNGDDHLLPDSPCINAGSNDAVTSLFDIDGQGRVFGGRIDIGADEYWSDAMSVVDAKNTADGALISGSGAVVSAAFPDFFYIESDDRSSGIRVEMPSHGLSAGARADISGSMTTTENGERCIVAKTAEESGSGSVLPLGLSNIALGGGKLGLQEGVCSHSADGVAVMSSGLNNIGLLVRVWGSVTQIGDGYFYIDDGSRLKDGTMTGDESNIGVRISGDGFGHQEGQYVVITGVSSCISGADGRLIRNVLPLN